jgi:protein-disulfide isomerase
LNKTSWIIFSVVTAGLFGLLIFFSNTNSTKINVDSVNLTAVQTGNKQNGNIGDQVFGKAGSKVTLINYGDFQCPGCGSAHSTIKTVTELYKEQIQFVFRNFVLTDIHANAKAAAGAAEAAGLQGKYWEMHNKIYESQSDWENLSGTERADFFTNYAKSLKLDTTKFNTDVASSAIGDKLDYDKALGVKAGVDATPTFYLNGTKLDSDVWGDEAKLKDAINTELKKAGIELPASEK